MLTIHQVSKNFQDKIILNQANLTLYKGEIVCLMGSNGAGKSTLFKMIQGIDTEYSGSIEYHPQLKIITIQQEIPNSTLGLFEYIYSHLEIAKDLKDIEILEEKISQGQADQKTLDIYGEKRSLFEKNGGYEIIYEVKKVLEGLDFQEETTFHRPINTLSGGEIRRALLAKALVQKADLILLDEPTNHLDLKNISFLESFLKKSGSTVFFISHDIEFIENIAQVIVSLSLGKLDRFEGNYQQYLKYIEEYNTNIDKKTKLIESEIKTLRPTAEKFRAGTRSNQAKNLFRRIELLEEELNTIGQKIIFDKAIHLSAKISFEKAINPILSIENVDISIQDRLLFHISKLHINEHEHWALLGRNGAGKTTLIRELQKAYEQKNSRILFSRNASLGIYKQEDIHFFEGKENLLTLKYLQSRFLSTYKDTDYHKFLKDFGIFYHLPIRSLSGGEKSKLRLLTLLLEGHNFLILDEPTNHMDMASVQGICSILKDYKGSIILVTHDRKILRTLKPHIIMVEDQQLLYRDPDLLPSVLNDLSSYKSISKENSKKAKDNPSKPKMSQNKLKYLEKEREKTLIQLEKLETTLKELEEKSYLPEFYENKDQFNELQELIKKTQQDYDTCYAYWESIESQLEI